MNRRKPALILPFLLLALLSTAGGSNAYAQDTQNKAGLVLQFPGGTTQTYCIPFTGDTISGFDLLMKTGLPVKVQAYGGLGVEVCQIGDTGCNYPDQPCACQSYGPGGVYWSYHHLKNGKWVASVQGAGSYKVHNGDVEGWAWSDGKPPALYTFSQLCPAAAPQPAATDTPQPPRLTEPPATSVPSTATRRPPAPSPTRKPQPTSTPRPAEPTPPQAQPTLTPTELPQPSPTDAALPTSTPATPATSTPTPTATLQPTNTPTAPTPTPTPIRNPQSAIRDQKDVARTFGLAIGGIVLGSLAIWGIVTAVRRTRNGGNSNVE